MKLKLSYVKQFDLILLACVGLLVSISLATIYSLDLAKDNPDFLNFNKQLVFAVLGLAFLLFFSFLDYRLLRNYSFLIYTSAVIFLISVLFLGSEIHGTKGWFYIRGFGIQPVELAKIALIIYLASFFARHSRESRRFSFIGITGVITFGLIALVLLQPDLGSATILALIWLGILLISGIKRKHLLILVSIFLIIFIFAWFFLLKDYQKARIQTFFNPSLNPRGSGYNVTQSIVAVGSGKTIGRGLESGSQSQLKFLPAAETDFIFAVIAEKLGMAGAGLVLIIWFVLFYRGYNLLRRVHDEFALFLIIGAMIYFFAQVFLNVGMNIGIAPVMGLPLPFLSAGGSSLLTSLAIIGILESINIRNPKFRSA
ncbi:MAG: rod shape-determining protein RodA [bacterium]